MNTVGVAVLAAGESRRMGTPKLLLPWGRATVIESDIRQWESAGNVEVAVVCAPSNAELFAELDRIGFPRSRRIVNTTPHGDMFSSIQSASRWPLWNPGTTQWVITLGDQPHLRLNTCRALLQCGAANPGKVCQPWFAGKRRHPVLLPERLFRKLALTRATNLKEFLEQFEHEIVAFESDDAGLLLDMDTPEAYERLKQQFWPAV